MFQMLNCLFQKLFNTWVRKRDSSLKSFPSLDLKKTRKKGRSWKSVLTRYSEILSFNLIKFAHLTNVIFLKFYLLLKQNKGCLIWKVRIRDKDALMMLHDQLLSKKKLPKVIVCISRKLLSLPCFRKTGWLLTFPKFLGNGTHSGAF